MDNELRSGKDKKSDDQLEQTLDKALMLFRYIQVGYRAVHSTLERVLMLIKHSSPKPSTGPIFSARSMRACLPNVQAPAGPTGLARLLRPAIQEPEVL